MSRYPSQFTQKYILGCVILLAFSWLPTLTAQDKPETFTQVPTIEESQVRDAEPSEPAEPTKTTTPKKAKKNSLKSTGPRPNWIWGGSPKDNSTCFLKTTFAGGSKEAALIATCDNGMVIYLNGKKVTQSSSWESPVTSDVQRFLKAEENELLVEATNQGGQAGFVLKLELTQADGSKKYVITNKGWTFATSKDAKEWKPVSTVGKLGDAPWGNIFVSPKNVASASGGARNIFETLPGFQVELLYTVPKATQGSWVNIGFDQKGRLLASDQGKEGIFRITPPAIGSKDPTKVEKLDVKMSGAQGMLAAFDSFYFCANGGPGSGFYRARDTNGDDQYDEITKLKSFAGGGEHGPHALRLSPDGKSIYVIAGNHTNPPQDFDSSRIPSNWSEDLLLPRQWDARGHARGKLAPGGWICKTDPDGKTWEVFSMGYRNPYSMDFNADGELFAYDADMEWDLGSPWYRPTRVVHATSGSEFGWRSGTGKWPTYYEDSLPPAVNIGPGSPVGAMFGYGAKFPAKYQKAFFILDWTFGTIYAIHLEPKGSTYHAVKEEFLSRTPLPLTDLAIGPDGAMYFTIGGRGTQSELFRVTYVGKESTAPVETKNQAFAELRAVRHKLEQYHSQKDDKAIDMIWSYLGHEDRFIRYAARVALEQQNAAAWQEKVFTEKNPQAVISATIALARQGDKALQSKALQKLASLNFESLSTEQQLGLLRAYQLLFIRMGEPSLQVKSEVAKHLDAYYPAKKESLNRELSRLLAYLNSPTMITKTLKLMEQPYEPQAVDYEGILNRHGGYGGTVKQMLANMPELPKIDYAFALRTMKYGWTLDQRKEYFKWLDGARTKSGGASYQGFIDNIRKEALANASEAEQKALESTVLAPPPPAAELPKPIGPGKKWTLDELVELTNSKLVGRDFEHGKRSFAASRCIVCHRFGGEGGATGPDLTNVAGRFSPKDLSDSLVNPSKVISDQYRAHNFLTASGKAITGRLATEENGKLTILIDPEDPNKVVEIDRDDIEEMAESKVSLMPKDLLNTLNEQEVLDLIAYLLSRGNPNDPMFQK